ncbi:hydroxyacid dehydrogenase [Kineosporia babensis]
MEMPNALVVMDEQWWHTQFDEPRRRRLRSLSQAVEPLWLPDFDQPGTEQRLAEVEVLLTGWGVPTIDAWALSRMPRLRAVLHCAGSVRHVVSPQLWERGIQVSNSADLNADPVAEFTFAAVVMAGKKAPFLSAAAQQDPDPFRFGRLSNTGLTIGVVGFSRIGRRVVRLITQNLREVTCLVADPYAEQAAVEAAGAELTSLEAILPRVDILTLHAPDLPSTRQMIGAQQLAALPEHCCVINTARGALIDTAALTEECRRGRLNAMLDVTDPEPLPLDSPLRTLPNVMLTPHIAGSTGSETIRMSEGALDELERLVTGRPLARPIRRESAALQA